MTVRGARQIPVSVTAHYRQSDEHLSRGDGHQEMSLPRSRSRGAPSPALSHKSYNSRVSQSPGPGSEVRSDSFWEKVGTLGRKKKAQVITDCNA